jgi:hypothetical protein
VIRYALRHLRGLVPSLDNGRLELDTNTVERAIRPIALGCKNADRLAQSRHSVIASLGGHEQLLKAAVSSYGPSWWCRV